MMSTTTVRAMEAMMIQNEVVLLTKGKSTFMPKRPVTTVRGSMTVLKMVSTFMISLVLLAWRESNVLLRPSINSP